ncbi:MAG TPA: efflux RND transporter periplasmic adaptor subunit [Longimicrobiales bacterium]|nr:efflux RND transporter periplasmic adaptor subunit [Longimicrobiales bacterium]
MERMKRVRVAIVVVALALLAVAGWYARGTDGESGLVATGTVEATTADLGFQAGGRIEAVLVVEGEAVAAGQELARLESAELRARRQAAQAQLEAARALLAELRSGTRREELMAARAAEEATRHQLAEATRTVERMAALEAGGAVSREVLDHAVTTMDVARSRHAQAAEQVRLLEAGPRPERVAAQAAAVRQAEAAVAQVDAALQHAVVRAPFAGVVTVRHRQPGEAVQPGAPVLTVTDLSDRWVRIYVREDRVGAVSLGTPAGVVWDGAPSVRHAGRVTFIGSEAEFTPRNVQTAEQRVKLVYAVKVAVTGDTALVLKPGLPVDVTLHHDP